MAAANKADASGVPAVVTRAGKNLAEVMQARREGCEEFESVPGGSTADVVGGAAEEGTGGGAVGSSEARRACTSDTQLVSLLEQRRDLCQVLESQPEARPPEAQGGYAKPSDPLMPRGLPTNSAKVRAGNTSDDELRRWMERMRGRCEVLENLPEKGAADALWSDPQIYGEHEDADARGNFSMALDAAKAQSSQAASRPGQASKTAAHGASSSETSQVEAAEESWKRQLQLGPLSHAERTALWARRLPDDDEEAPTLIATPALLQLLKVGGAGAEDQPSMERLADAFHRKFAWPGDRPAGSLLVQLLRYHHPEAAEHLNAASPDVAAALLAPVAEAAEALLLLCDLLVLEGKDLLLLFVAVVLLAERSAGSGFSTEDVQQTLAGLGSRGFEAVRTCLESASQLHDATPVSLLPAHGTLPSSEQSLPVCAVAPQEVLRHVYERPACSWRLVVLDVRRETMHFALPVCIRIGTQEDRKSVVQDIPYEGCIHLCILADHAPALGEEAIELAQDLVRGPSWRKHVSVVLGGWEAIQLAAESAGFELSQVETEKDGRMLVTRVGGIIRKAQAAVVKAQGETGEKAQAVVRKAQGFLAGAGHAIQRLARPIGASGASAGPKGSTEGQREYDVQLGDGTLGFDISGSRVVLVDAGGQAEAQGVQVGDSLVAVAGRRLPAPPADEPAAQAELKLKRIIRRWIEEQGRPVRLRFASAE